MITYQLTADVGKLSQDSEAGRTHRLVFIVVVVDIFERVTEWIFFPSAR